MGDSLVGVTPECDCPVEVDRLPKLTRSRIPPGLSSEQIDTVVNGVGVTYKTLERIDVVVGAFELDESPPPARSWHAR